MDFLREKRRGAAGDECRSWSSHLLAAVVCRQICSIRPVQKLFWSDGGRSAHAIVIQVGLDSVAAFFSQQDRSIIVEVRLCCANTPSQP